MCCFALIRSLATFRDLVLAEEEIAPAHGPFVPLLTNAASLPHRGEAAVVRN
jgi:hypothetical protein